MAGRSRQAAPAPANAPAANRSHGETKKLDKQIVLPKFNAKAYRNWVFQVKATLSHFDVWNIVQGLEQTPIGDVVAIDNYNAREKQVFDALVSAMNSQDVTLIRNATTSKEIWDLLKAHYGETDQIKWIEAWHALAHLMRDSSTKHEDHVRNFISIMDDFLYHAPANFRISTGAQNLLFIGTLGTDWQDFHRTIRKEIDTMPPQELFNQVGSALFDLPHANEVKALRANISNGNKRKLSLEDRIGSNKKQKKSKKGKNGGKKTSNANSDRIFTSGSLAGLPMPPPRDPSVTCSACSRVGHKADNCMNRLWVEALQKKDSVSSLNRGDSDYLPSFNFNAKITRYTALSVNCHPDRNPYIWVLDSGANAIITPFQDRLHNYKAFGFPVEVHGIGGVPVEALGKGSLALQDPSGNFFTLRTAVYVPDSPDSILSLMELEEQGLEFSFIRDPSTDHAAGHFRLTASGNSDFALTGHAIDKLLYVAEAPAKLPEPAYRANISRKAHKRLNPTIDNDAPIVKPKPLIANDENWHLRLQHTPSSTIQKHPLLQSNYDTAECQSCIKAKQHRNPYKSDSEIPAASRVNERVHSDLAGPYINSKGNSKYLMTFLDDRTQWAEVVMLKNKKSCTLRRAIARYIRRAER